MHFIIVAALATVALGSPQYGYEAPRPRSYGGSSSEEIAILRDSREQDDYGRYSVNVETANGIVLAEAGAPEGNEGAVVSSGSFSYTAPDGTPVSLKYVADENGFQPQSDLLPVAPEFPHPIPQFVLEQIAKAAEEDARERKAPSGSYGAPQ